MLCIARIGTSEIANFHVFLANMLVTIDKYGRILIPKIIRERLGLKINDRLLIEDELNKLVIKLVEVESSVVEEGGLLVYVGDMDGDINVALQNVRAERDANVLDLN